MRFNEIEVRLYEDRGKYVIYKRYPVFVNVSREKQQGEKEKKKMKKKKLRKKK